MSTRLPKPILIFLLLLPGLGLILGFISIVIYFAVAQSFGHYNFGGESYFTLAHWANLKDDTHFWRAFFYSLRIATVSALASVLLAYPLATWLRKPFPGSTIVGAILKIPYLVPGLVAAFLYVNFISYRGFLNQLLDFIGLVDEPIRMQNDDQGIGVIILQIWKNTPFALLLLVGAVSDISDDIYHAARDAGAKLITRFLQITLPLTLQTLQVALIIIFIGAAGDFSFQTIAGPRTVYSMAQFMYSAQTINHDWNYSAVIAVMLMAMSLIGSVSLAGIVQVLIRGRLRG
jgi:putative spermidine/putrescine transport system permease protein